MKGEGRGGGGMDDIFSMFGGGGPRGQQKPRGPQKGKPVHYPLKVTLEEIYNGKKTKIAVNRERIRPDCEDREKIVTKCPECKGRGMVTKMVQLGPGMYSQSSGHCENCRGKGEIIDKKYMIKEKKIIEAEIDKGSPDGC